MNPWERYAGAVEATQPPPEERKPWDRYAAPAAAVEPADVPRGTSPVEQGDPRPRLRSESFKMLNDAGRLSPRMQRDIADNASGVVGGTIREGKGVLGGIAESLGEAIANPFTKTEAASLNATFGENWDREVAGDLVAARDKDKGNKTLDSFVQYFQGNGITDGKEMMSILKDSIAENNWDATSDDGARVLSDGTLRVNPKFVALPDAQEGIKAIQAAPVDDATRQQETQRFLAARKMAAASLDQKARDYDAGYRKYADEQAAKGITDPEQVFFSWPGLDRNWIEGSWDVVRDTVAQSGRDIYNAAVRGPALALADATGDQEDVARIGKDIIESGKKGEFTRELAAARGQEGAITGTGKELGTTVLDMVPMFAGAGAGRLIAGGAEAGAVRQILGKITQGTSVYGYAGAQGYASLMQTALEAADRKAEMEDRELTPQEIDDTVTSNQGAALANGFQTAILSKILGGGVEKVALEGLAARGATMTGRDVLAAFRQRYGADGVRAAVLAVKPELKEFAKQAYQAGKTGFKDEALEEGLNQYLEGVLTKAGADPDKTWDQIGQETFKGAWMGGVIGGGLPVAQQTMANSDPVALAARQLAASAQTDAPLAAQAAAETFDTNEEGTQAPEGDGARETPPPASPEAPAAPLAEAAAAGEVVAGGTTGLEDLGGAGKAIAENFRNAIRDSLEKTGEVPPQEKNSPLGRAWGYYKNVGGEVDGFMDVMARVKEDTLDGWAEAFKPVTTDEPGTPSPLESLEAGAPPGPGSPAVAAVEGSPAAVVGAEPAATPDVAKAIGDLSSKWGNQGVRLDLSIADSSKPNDFSEGDTEGAIRLDYIKVPEDRRTRGIGSEAIEEVKALADATGRPVELFPTTEDSGLPAFYEKRGFQRYERKNPSNGKKRADGFRYIPANDATLPAPENAPAPEPAGTPAAAAAEPAPASAESPAVVDVPVQGDPTVYSPENLATTFNLTPEQAAATDALVQSMGLDTSKIRLTKGGRPGSGIQPAVSRASGQGIKGSFELLPTGEALLRGLTNPDVSTAVHELSHVARKTLFTRGDEGPVAGITDDDIDAVERWAGADGGNWSVAAEEKFARGFERYLRDGKAPTKALTPVFEKIGNWLKSIYASVKGSPIDVQIPPAIRAVFDRMVARNAAPETVSPPPENLGTPSETAPSETVSPPAPQTAESPENLTSVKNEATDAELKAFGFDPIAAPASQALDVSWERALARLERNPAAGQALVDELNTKPRATDDVEHGMLLKMLADAKLAYGRTQQDLTDAELSGDLARIEEAHRQNDIARDAVFNIITAAKATGTVWGRTGRFRQLAIDEDYSLVQMEAKFRTEVNQGKSLSKEQAAEVKRMQAEIEAAKKDLEDYRAKEAERLAAAVHEATLAAIRRAKPQVRKNLGSKIEEAKKRLKALGLVNPDADARFLAQEAFPPEVVEDLATVAAGWMVDGNPTPEVFADRLKRMFGDQAAGQAEVIQAKAREIIDATIEETFNATTGDTVAGNPVTRKPKSREQVVEDIDAAEGLQGSDVFRLARLHINEGVEGFENVMKAVQADLEAVFPGVTLREIHDAYSGYGKTVFPSKEADLIKLREYRTLARLTSQLEDATKGLSPKRTGMQRDKSSERVRTLQKQVRDMMRKMGIAQVSDDQRLKSSLDAVKTRLRNEIEELEVAIRDRAPRPEGSKGVDYDQEANDLKAQRDMLREEYQQIFGKRELTDEDRIRMTVKALEKRIEETEKLIAEGKGKRDRVDRPAVTSPEIEALRAKLGGLNEQRNALRDREKERLERTKKMVRNRIGKIQDRIKRGDYEPAQKLPPVKADEELGKLQRAEITAKRQFNEKLYEAQLARRSRGQKIYDGVIEVFNASRSIITSADLSAVLRQGGFIVFGNPLRAARGVIPMLRAGISADYAQNLADTISKNPKFLQSQKAGLFLSEFGDTHHFSKMEEQFRGKLAKNIPGIGKVVEFSERTYTAFLNKLRMDTFEAMANSVSPTGDLTEGEAKVIANFINIATGRGNLERFDKSAEVLAAAFFSPKYVVSRFQLLAMPMTGFRAGQGASMRTRKAIATEYAKTALGIGSIYTLVQVAKAMLDEEDEDKVTVETDPRSSDFGKVKIGNTRVDFLFGMLQATVFLSRVWTGEKKRADGEIVAMRGDDAGFGESTAGTLGTFLRTKLAPIPGTMVNMIDGKDVVGNKVFWETELIGNLMPLSMGDIFATMKEQGVPAGTALGLLAIFGAGAATYSTDDEDLNLEQEIAVKLGAPASRYAED